MANGEQASRVRFLYSSLRGGISSTAPYGSQGPYNESGQRPVPPLVDGQNMIWHRGALRPAWRWTPLDSSSYVNPFIDGNIASRQKTDETNAQYVVDGMLFTTGSTGQQVYVILTDGELFINGVAKNPDLGHITVDLTLQGAAFSAANQPANDGIEVISSDAGDTTQTVTLYGTTTGTDTLVTETVTLNGLTEVPTVKTNWGLLLAAKVSAATVGTVTIREASGNQTIVAIAPADPRSKGIVTVPDTQEARSAYFSKPTFAASGTTTRQIGISGLNSSGATIYDSQALTGATRVVMNTAFASVHEVYVGDIEDTRTMTMTYGGMADYTGAGNGTAWLDTGVKVGDLFKIDSDDTWRVISDVTTNTNLDTVTNPGAGAEQAYQIRRTFARGVTPGSPSMTLLNGDLFVACRCGGVSPTGKSDWCILRYADIFNTPITEQSHEYALATWNITGYIQSKSIIPEITDIHGIQATEDGRICIACSESGAGNRIRWCSVADVFDWTGEDANFTDLVPSNGEVKAFKKIGKSLVSYFVDSIHVGTPTGDRLFPFNFHRSRAAVGTRWQRAVCEVPDGNLYVGSDFRVYIFDGDREKPLTDDTLRRWLRGPDEQYFLVVEVPVLTATAEATASVGTVIVA